MILGTEYQPAVLSGLFDFETSHNAFLCDTDRADAPKEKAPLQCSIRPNECQSVPPSTAAPTVSNAYAMDGVNPCDIVCGRDSSSFNHCGNRRFRVTIGLHLSRYNAAHGKQERSELIASIIHLVKDEVGARFLKKKNGKYVELNNREMRQKVGHALRDMSCNNQKSLKAERRGSDTTSSTTSASAVAIKKAVQKSKEECSAPTVELLGSLEDESLDDFSSDVTSVDWSL